MKVEKKKESKPIHSFKIYTRNVLQNSRVKKQQKGVGKK